MPHYTPESLHAMTLQVLAGFGCDDHEAAIVATHLIEANLAGHDSHGIGMLPMYGEQVQDGNLVPNQTPVLHDPIGAITVVDAQRGFGHRMSLLALDHAMQTLDEHKVAILGMRNSGHVSRVGTYAEYCASRGYVSIHTVNVVGHPPIVAPFGSRESGFSTNPISMAMPVAGTASPLLDLATSTVAFGKVRVAHTSGARVPSGWLIDEAGVDTCDPGPMAEERRGSLSAFGAHKGSGLGLFVELLSGALAGTDTVATMEHLPHGVINNLFSVIIDPEAFDSRAAVERRTQDLIDFIHARAPATGVEQVLMPGDPENISRQRRRAHGVPVDEPTLAQIVGIAGDFGVDEARLRSSLETMSD